MPVFNFSLKTLSVRIVFILLIVLSGIGQSGATHLMGGELTYRYDGNTQGGAFYTVKLIVYRYCDASGGATASLDPSMMLGIYVDSASGVPGQLSWFATESISLTSSEFVTDIQGNSNCPFQSTACIERGVYEMTILLPEYVNGHHLIVERCCRNGNIINIDNPGAAGMSYYAFVPPGIANSSPEIATVSVPYVCTGDTVSIVNNAYDPDGDSLVYSFVVPYNGYSSSINPMPDPQFSSNPYQLPIPDVLYAAGYSQSLILGAGGFTSIDANSGLTKYFFPLQGFYVVAVEIREYRNGQLIASTRRDLQFISIACLPNSVPSISNTGSGGIYTVVEGQQLCFNVSFSDADGDSLYMTSSGPLLDGTVVSPPGVILDKADIGTVTSQFCWTTSCGMSRPAPYQFTVTVTDNGCPQKTTSQVFSVYVEPVSPTLIPTVSITQDPPGILCQGSQVSFVAGGTMQGNTPQYMWYLNGAAAGTSDSVFTPATINDGDVITVTLISDAPCLFNDTAYSPPYVVTVNPQPAPQVNITSNPPAVLCPQQICLFTANVTNAGANPTYQWYINGSPGGTNQPAFTAANPAGMMSVYVIVTPSTGCLPQNSNTIDFNILPSLSPEVYISATASDSICPGQQVTFFAASVETGNTPVYNWMLNGVSLGLSNDTITLSILNNGDEVTVSVTSSYPCLSPAFTYADPLVYHHYPALSGNLTDGPVEICSGLPVELRMTPYGGKPSTYTYSWSYGNSTLNAIGFVPPFTGYYYASVDDECYDAVTDSIFINVLPVPVSDFLFTPDNPSVFFPEVQFTDRSLDAMAWEWDFGDGTGSNIQNPLHEYVAFGRMPVALVTTNSYNCTDTLIRFIEIESILTGYFPNSFTPNADGKNDLFGPVGNLTGGYTMAIFNRWGQQIFSTSNSGLWNGENGDGSAAPSGTYVYQIRFLNEPAGRVRFGTVNLIR